MCPKTYTVSRPLRIVGGTEAASSADGRLVAVAEQNSAQLWDTDTGTAAVPLVGEGGVGAMALHPTAGGS